MERAHWPELLAVSDSHGDAAVLEGILDWGRRRGVSALAHLGDGAQDMEDALSALGWFPPRHRVRGNMDGDHALPLAKCAEFAGKTFLLTHGHHEGVTEGYDRLTEIGRSMGADAVLFGHTHRAFWEEYSGILILNPGSPSRPRGAPEPSFATIEVPDDGWFLVHRWTVERSGSRVKVVTYS